MLLKQSSALPGATTFNLFFVQPVDTTVLFSEKEIQQGGKDWDLALVGYAIDKRPYYSYLLDDVKRKRKLKGSFRLLVLEGDLFLFKFSCKEDFGLDWNYGPCFFNGKPFVFYKLSWDFTPTFKSFDTLDTRFCLTKPNPS